MKRRTRIHFMITFASVAAVLFVSSCVKNEIDYKVPDESTYFDFSTKKSIDVNIDYGYEDYKVNFSIYAENPYNENGSKNSDIEPIFGSYTDDNSKFIGKVDVPSYLNKIYVCSDYIAIPSCLEIDIENNSADYKYSEPSENPILQNLMRANSTISHEKPCIDIQNQYSTINNSIKLYALYKDINTRTFVPANSSKSIYGTLNKNAYISKDSKLSQLLSRLNSSLTKKDNSNLITSDEVTNIRIAHKTTDGEDIVDAHLDLVFVDAKGGYTNAMAYYYYKSDASLSGAQIRALPKYFVYPRTIGGATNKPSSVLTCRLQFFGENYDQPGTDDFPAGYTIGWLLVADICGFEYPYNGNSGNYSSSTNLSTSTINDRIASAYNAGRYIYSNKSANTNQIDGVISLFDSKSEKIIIGFEDQSFKGSSSLTDNTFEDILFYVDVDPVAAIYDPDRPDLPEPEEDDLQSFSYVSTLAFEDIWPNGGDYDINDVMVEYTGTYYYNNNNQVVKIIDAFKATNNGAAYTDAFGYVINGTVGAIDEESSYYSAKEEANQFILFSDIKGAVGKTFKVVRDLSATKPSIQSFQNATSPLINPFIVSQYVAGQKNRTEIHLPKYTPTSWCNTSERFTGDDAYYINKDGKYPFAFELVGAKNFAAVTETVKIGSPNEYPTYIDWVESAGSQCRDWYLHKR